MDAYLWLKYVHVAAAVIWVGGGFALFLVNNRLSRARDYEAQAALGRHAEAIGMQVFMPASIILLGTGLWMVGITPQISFADLWILFGYGGIAVSVGIGMGLTDPAGKRMAAALTGDGPESSDYQAALRKLNTANMVELAVLFFVIWAMVAKPTL